MLTRLKVRGIIGQAPLSGISTRKPPRSRPCAVRQPKDCQVHRPGDLTQMDTLDVRPLPGTVEEHFTARDVVSRWDVLGVYARATATPASSCLDTVLEHGLFAVRALQVDGGSEFESAFETACQKHGIRIFVLPPGARSSQQARGVSPTGPTLTNSARCTMGLLISPLSTAPFGNGSMSTIVCALIGPWTAEPRHKMQKILKAAVQRCPQPLNRLIM